MSLKDKWSKSGKNIGHAFANFGKAMGTTAKIVFTDEKNEVDENGESKLKKAWKETGKGFGEAGKSTGQAFGATAKKVVDDIDESSDKEGKADDGIDRENAIDDNSNSDKENTQ